MISMLKLMRGGIAADRRCPGQETLRVRDVFAEEFRSPMALPDNPYPLLERVTITAGKTPYLRFDLNDYSVPPHPCAARLVAIMLGELKQRRMKAAGIAAPFQHRLLRLS
jgi:hypothetical protein